MQRVLPAPLAELVEIQTLLHVFFVAARKIVDVVALAALESDEIILRHTGVAYTCFDKKKCALDATLP